MYRGFQKAKIPFYAEKLLKAVRQAENVKNRKPVISGIFNVSGI
jgi:hypothetical protein